MLHFLHVSLPPSSHLPSLLAGGWARTCFGQTYLGCSAGRGHRVVRSIAMVANRDGVAPDGTKNARVLSLLGHVAEPDWSFLLEKLVFGGRIRPRFSFDFGPGRTLGLCSLVPRGRAEQSWRLRWASILSCAAVPPFVLAVRLGTNEVVSDFRHAGVSRGLAGRFCCTILCEEFWEVVSLVCRNQTYFPTLRWNQVAVLRAFQFNTRIKRSGSAFGFRIQV